MPWQDVAAEASLDTPGLEILPADRLRSERRWALMTRRRLRVSAKVIDESDPDHGYGPVLRAFGDRLRETLE